eukprot:GHRQ01030085.1.p1 GENE.GHRQ01030085.1~~GHRQ01030085.1.p1  ORF type:complete len:142 (+),score=25.86 GHRQ01030085.1:364-789(+)
MLPLQQRAAAEMHVRTYAVLLRPAISTACQLRASRTRANATGQTDPTNAFISQFRLEGAASGPLGGLTLAVKDLYDIAGHKTGFGNPTWLETHPTADVTSPAVAALLAAGATVRGSSSVAAQRSTLGMAAWNHGMPCSTWC